MPALVVTPNPTKPERAIVEGSGFDPAIFIALVFDGSGTSIKIPVKPDGSFSVGLYIASTKKDGTYKLEARKFGSRTALTTVNVVVKRVVEPPPTPPVGPTISNILAVDMQNGAEISWKLSEPSTGQIEYGPTTAYGTFSTLETGYLPSHRQVLTGLLAGTLYHYRIISKNQIGGVATSEDFTFTTLGTLPTPVVPPAPGGLTTTAGNKYVTANWGAISLATYKVYRNGALIASPTTTTFTDTGLVNGQQYSYQVSAVNAVGEGPKAGPVYATPVAAPGNTVTVNSITAIKSNLANNNLSEIVVVDGTYATSPATSQAANSLWIGAAYASRTNPITVRAQTPGGVHFDGGGGTLGGIIFVEGSHHQTWDGFVFQNGNTTQTGVIVFGGYAGRVAAHHITLKNITVANSAKSSGGPGVGTGHSVYFSQALGGVHDILIDGYTVQSNTNESANLDSALHFYHSSSGNPNAYNVIVRNMTVTGTDQAIVLWDATLRNIRIEDSTITNATGVAIRYETTGSTDIVFENVTSINSGGFYSGQGPNPAEISFINCSLN